MLIFRLLATLLCLHLLKFLGEALGMYTWDLKYSLGKCIVGSQKYVYYKQSLHA